MKNYLRILIGIVVGVFIFLLIKGRTPEVTEVTETPISLSYEDRFKQDMLEGIMEFVSDSVPIDSLYIPDWLK